MHSTFAEQAALARALSIRFQKRHRILKMVAGYVAAERLRGLERDAVARINVGHLTFAYDNERLLMNAVLPRI